MIDWPANWTASVYLQPKSSLLEHSVEYLSYDPNVCGLAQRWRRLNSVYFRI